MFDLQNMIKTIKKIPGANFTNEEYFNYTFDYLIKTIDIRYGGNRISFDETRASKVLNYKEYLYASICNTINLKNSRELFYETAKRNYTFLFDNIDEKKLIDALFDLVNDDCNFDKELKKKLIELYTRKEYKSIYAELLLYAVKIELLRRKNRDRLDIKTKTAKIKIDKSIIADIVSRIVINNKEYNNIKHIKAWTLDEKIEKNKINYVLKMKMKYAFEDYELVMSILDEMCNADIMIKKYLYSFYQNIYFDVLGDFFKDDINQSDILNNSSEIFEKVNLRIYDTIFQNKNNNLEYEKIHYNLFALTVAVFYQCKFLIPMEEINDSY